MSISLGSNLSSLRAMRELGTNRNSLAQIFERLSSGQRINRAADDAAGLAISEILRTNSRIISKGLQNTNDAISLLNIAEGAVDSLTDIVTRQLELAEQSANGVYTNEQRTALNSELVSLYEEYTRILNGTQFNGINILDVDFGRMTIQTGGNSVSLDVLAQETVSAGELIFDGYDTTDVNNHAGSTVIAEDRLLVTDYNGDGFDDLVTIGLADVGKATQLVVRLYTGSEDGLTLSSSQGISVGAGKVTGYTSFAAGMVSGTQIQLIVTTNNGVTTQGSLNIAPGSGTIGAFSNGVTSLIGDQSAFGSISADFNGDGFNDSVQTADTLLSIPPASGFLRFRLSRTLVSSEEQRVSISLERLSADILSESSALNALDTLKEDLLLLSNTRAAIGASLSRLTVTQSILQTKRAELEAADDRIRSADIAEESSKLVLSQIREEAASAVLAQANIQPNIALQLLNQEQ